MSACSGNRNFAFDTVSCPSRLRFGLGRPACANNVGDTGTPNPNRRGFIAWMEELELALTGASSTRAC